MKKNGAIWVALVVVAVAALLMFFVVLPQMRSGKAVDQLAKKAGETVEQAKDTAQKAADQTQDAVKQAVADPKTAVLQKMARLKSDGEAATVEFEALFADNKKPTVEQVVAARAKLEAALKGASEIALPDGLDATAAAMVAKTTQGAKAALALLDAMPTDAVGAKNAYDALKTTITAALSGADLPKTFAETATKPADTANKPVDAADAALTSFDVLRVEKDGSTVIAGRAVPGAKIDILDGDAAIASTKAGDSGDFVAVLDNPLPAGDHQLVLRATGKDGKADVSAEVATVSVPADKSGELLAMVTKPGEASRIMTAPEAKPETVVAQNTTSQETAQKPVVDQATKDVAPVAKQETVEPAKDTAAAANGEQKTPAQPVEVAKTENTDTSVKPVATQDTASNTANTAAGDTTEVTKAETADTKPVDKVATAPEVMVSAVEIEGDKIFVAGSARPKSVVRVYADDKLVAEVSTDANGRFVADSTQPLSVGDHMIRADVLSSNGKKVEFRASVPFFRPEGEQLAAVAGDVTKTDKQAMQPLADGNYDKAREEAGKAVSLLKGLYDAGRTPTLDELAAARSATEIALKTLAQIKLGDNGDPVAKEMADKTAGKAAEALALLKSLPQDAGAVKTALNSIDKAVTSAVAPSIATAAASSATTPTAKEQWTADTAAKQPAAGNTEVATDSDKLAPELSPKLGKAETETAATSDQTNDALTKPATQVAAADTSQPKVIEQAPLTPSRSSVIIRRGDTLWQISRRVYGRGVRYTTIYVANEPQIADPDRILPGQIFGVPDKYLPNSEELHRERLDHKKH